MGPVKAQGRAGPLVDVFVPHGWAPVELFQRTWREQLDMTLAYPRLPSYYVRTTPALWPAPWLRQACARCGAITATDAAPGCIRTAKYSGCEWEPVCTACHELVMAADAAFRMDQIVVAP